MGQSRSHRLDTIQSNQIARSGFKLAAERTPQVADVAPTEAHLTDYDREHLALFIRLLDAANADASWRDVAETLLGIDPEREPERAQRAYDTHLSRARWIMDQGYRDLLRGDGSP